MGSFSLLNGSIQLQYPSNGTGSWAVQVGGAAPTALFGKNVKSIKMNNQLFCGLSPVAVFADFNATPELSLLYSWPSANPQPDDMGTLAPELTAWQELNCINCSGAPSNTYSFISQVCKQPGANSWYNASFNGNNNPYILPAKRADAPELLGGGSVQQALAGGSNYLEPSKSISTEEIIAGTELASNVSVDNSSGVGKWILIIILAALMFFL